MGLEKEKQYAAEISKLEKQRDTAIETERARLQQQVVIDTMCSRADCCWCSLMFIPTYPFQSSVF